MKEVEVIGKDLSGLGWTIKSLVDQNLNHPQVEKAASRIKGSLAIIERDSGVAVTLMFAGDHLSIRHGAQGKTTALLCGGFEELSNLISGEVGPIRAVLTGKVKAKGSYRKLLKMAKVIVVRDGK